MCGIIGYAGDENAPEVIIRGLKRLEYRGYDSAGLAVMKEGTPVIYKSAGRVEVLESKLDESLSDTHCGIGHTRWATHGSPNDINSHPHQSGAVVLVHNGIIENCEKLKDELKKSGKIPVSDTDTEVAAMVIDSLYNGEPISAIFNALRRFEGAYAFGILFKDRPDRIYAIRKDSPLVVGVSGRGNFIASDISAMPVDKYYLCEDGELAIVSTDSVEFYKDGLRIEKELLKSELDRRETEKDGYPHFMLKEIHEQPRAVCDTVRACKVGDGLLSDCYYDFETKGRIFIVACGSAMHAGLLGKYAIERLARIPVSVEVASEFRYADPILSKDDLIIAVSQSGETADTLAALRLAKSRGAKTLAIVNVPQSTLARDADHVLYTRAGVEVCVATTKAYLCQCTVLYAIAFRLARARLGDEQYTRYISELEQLPAYIEKALGTEDECRKAARRIKDAKDLFYIGRGRDKYVCDEGSLKLKEVSYLHSESYAAGELKHGTISLITDGMPVMAVMTDGAVAAKVVSNIEEAVSRGAVPFIIAKSGIDTGGLEAIRFDAPDGLFAPIVAAVPLQLIAYHTASMLDCDIDKPRNLAKSVTVE